MSARAESARREAPASAWVLRMPRADPRVEIWGLAPEERLRRALARAGCAPVAVGAAQEAPALAPGPVAIFRGDVVADERLVAALAAAPEALLVAPGLGPVAARTDAARAHAVAAALAAGDRAALAGLREVAPGELVEAYQPALRKREPPWVAPARADRAREVEAHAFRAAYKGVTDLVTRFVWPRPAAAVTRWCVRAGIGANAVTLASAALVVLATLCFATGRFGAGLLAAWSMTFLDTVDGKLARVTLTSSRLGHALDHGLDLLHPPVWYWAWGAGLATAGLQGVDWATALAVGGYVLGRLEEGLFLAVFGFELHSWEPLDSLFRSVTARRNPNLILLSVGALGGRPDLGLVMLALWTLASLGFHAARIARALARRRRGEPVAPWAARTGGA